jgi:hypothetical protein
MAVLLLVMLQRPCGVAGVVLGQQGLACWGFTGPGLHSQSLEGLQLLPSQVVNVGHVRACGVHQQVLMRGVLTQG